MEIWKSIVDYWGLYEVSNYGNVKATDITMSNRIGGNKNKLNMMHIATNHNGYSIVSLSKDGKRKYVTVHRLVANSFIPNILSKPFVNHKNGIKTDNRVENLEWCTAKENTRHYIDVLGRKPQSKHKKGKTILCTTNNMVFNSAASAARWIGATDTAIIKNCKGFLNNVKKHKFVYNEQGS